MNKKLTLLLLASISGNALSGFHNSYKNVNVKDFLNEKVNRFVVRPVKNGVYEIPVETTASQASQASLRLLLKDCANKAELNVPYLSYYVAALAGFISEVTIAAHKKEVKDKIFKYYGDITTFQAITGSIYNALGAAAGEYCVQTARKLGTQLVEHSQLGLPEQIKGKTAQTVCSGAQFVTEGLIRAVAQKIIAKAVRSGSESTGNILNSGVESVKSRFFSTDNA